MIQLQNGACFIDEIMVYIANGNFNLVDQSQKFWNLSL